MTTYSAPSPDLTGVTFFKTSTGLEEIQNRTLGLPALIRRVLVLVDGKRNGKELAAFVGNDANIVDVLGQLLASGCIHVQSSVKSAVAPAPAPAASAARLDEDQLLLARLPHPALRTHKEIEMARNFMINTTNNEFGQNMRLSLIKSILACQGTEELRQVYPAWASNMASTKAGAKSLPELREKLSRVL